MLKPTQTISSGKSVMLSTIPDAVELSDNIDSCIFSKDRGCSSRRVSRPCSSKTGDSKAGDSPAGSPDSEAGLVSSLKDGLDLDKLEARESFPPLELMGLAGDVVEDRESESDRFAEETCELALRVKERGS